MYEWTAETGRTDGTGASGKVWNQSVLCGRSGSGRYTDRTEIISPKRMKILERITDDRLKPVVERIKAYGTAGYQEMLMEEKK